MSHDPPTSVSLLVRARDGDEGAWERLVAIYGPIVLTQCRRKGFQEADAREIVQEIFVAVSAGLSGFRREKPADSFLRWLRTIATRKIADRFRRDEGNAQAVGGSTIHFQLQQTAEQLESEWQLDDLKREAYERAIDLMRTDFHENTWKAFLMTVVEGRSTRDVAAELKMGLGAVRQARSKVRLRLIAEMGDMLDMKPDE